MSDTDSHTGMTENTGEPESGSLDDAIEKQARRHPVLRWLVFLVLVFAVGGLLSFVVGNWVVMPLVVHSSTTQVPDLYGVDVGVAKRELVSRGLAFVNDSTDYVADELIPANHIVSQDPPPYSEVKSGRRVRVVISRGPRRFAVPDVVNSGATEAKFRLTRAGFPVGRLELRLRSRVDGSDPLVFEQAPHAGALASRDDSVHLVIDVDPLIPELRGRSDKHARKILALLGLRVGSVTYRSDEDHLPYSVIEQSVRAGTVARAGQRVDLVLSRL